MKVRTASEHEDGNGNENENGERRARPLPIVVFAKRPFTSIQSVAYSPPFFGYRSPARLPASLMPNAQECSVVTAVPVRLGVP